MIHIYGPKRSMREEPWADGESVWLHLDGHVICPDLLRSEMLGEADNRRGRIVRLFFRLLDRLWVLAPPKTRKGRRALRLSRLAVDALSAHRRRMAVERRPDWEHFGLVFVTPNGQPIYGWRVVEMLRGHLARLAIETAHPLRLHELRHGLASYMKADGVPDQVLADYLGHSTTRLLERYAHALPEADGLVPAAMERRLG